MQNHKYILEPYKGMNTRYRCPSCQQRDKTFSLYIDTQTGEHIAPALADATGKVIAATITLYKVLES